MERIVIVGAGQAAQSCAARLRAQGFVGAITIIGEEPHLPYQRPPLSKAYLLGEMALDRLWLRPEAWYTENAIRVVTSAPATAIDRAARRVVTAGGETHPYDGLVLATGAIPRRLPAAVGGDLAGVHVVRTLADVDRMAPDIVAGARLLVVGGGYIGLEAAAVARKSGMDVTLIEAAPRILGRVAAPESAAAMRALHAAHGVDIREGTGLARLTGGTRVTGADLVDGAHLEVDAVVVGIGVTPDTRLAAAARLAIDNGIAVDAQGRTSDPAILAAGDCASFPASDGGRMRLESVGNAIDMGELVADTLMGQTTSYVPKPWFWSDQFDAKLQIAGLGTGADRIVTRAGEGGAWSHWYFAGPRLLAVDALNDSRAYMVGKRLIEAGRSPDPMAIANPATDLKALLKVA
jgi:3-phenylpropionate/trans-cinnamate dioxygenase ferredoxin reductase subunit